MSSISKVYVAEIGMITAIGETAGMTAAATRAGINGYEVSEYKNWACKPVTMAMVSDTALPEICDELDTNEEMSDQIAHMLMMAHAALEEVMASYTGTVPLPLILSGPEIDKDLEVPFSYTFLDLLVTQSGIALDRKNCRLLGIGRAGVINGIDTAIKYLSLGHDYVLVGGIDSYQDYDLILKLAEQDRIKAEDSTNGFVPGEAAGFLLLTGKAELAKNFDGSVLCLSSPGLSQESGHFTSEASYTGDGLAQAFELALKNHSGQPISCVYSSMNGENYWAKEYGVAMLRCKKFMDKDVIHEHPADCYGDPGAATGAILIGLAGLSLARNGEEKSCLVYASSDSAYRSAVCMSLSHVQNSNIDNTVKVL